MLSHLAQWELVTHTADLGVLVAGFERWFAAHKAQYPLVTWKETYRTKWTLFLKSWKDDILRERADELAQQRVGAKGRLTFSSSSSPAPSAGQRTPQSSSSATAVPLVPTPSASRPAHRSAEAIVSSSSDESSGEDTPATAERPTKRTRNAAPDTLPSTPDGKHAIYSLDVAFRAMVADP